MVSGDPRTKVAMALEVVFVAVAAAAVTLSQELKYEATWRLLMKCDG